MIPLGISIPLLIVFSDADRVKSGDDREQICFLLHRGIVRRHCLLEMSATCLMSLGSFGTWWLGKFSVKTTRVLVGDTSACRF